MIEAKSLKAKPREGFHIYNNGGDSDHKLACKP